MNHSAAIWGTLFGAGTAYEIYAILRLPHGSISHHTRTIARVHHPVGKAAFVIGWGAFAVWYALHVIDPESVSHI
jgi:hypothetical protein